MNVRHVIKNFLIFTVSKTVKYVLHWWMKKVWPELCPFRTYLRVQLNISDFFERFSVSSCNKKMKTLGNLQEKFWLYECATCDKRFPYLYTFKDCQICTSVMKKTVWLEFCPFRTYLRVQHNISDIFERFSISSCNKKWWRRKPSRKILAVWMCHVWQTFSLSLLF